MKTLIKIIAMLGGALLLVNCYKPTPHNTQNICDIFTEYPSWYAAAKATEQKWGVPVAVQMAIIYQESGFQASVQPMTPAHKVFAKVEIWKPASSAQGYCQALKDSWECYQKSTGEDVSRDDFAAASDFIGWYAHMAQQMAHIQPTDAYDLYLAYHDGIGAFHSRSYLKHPWIIPIANNVKIRAMHYADQLAKCAGQIPVSAATQ